MVEEELRYLDAEETRLRYVAATRARELLVVGRWAKAGNSRPWGAFDPFLVGAPELPVPATVVVPSIQAAGISEASRAAANVGREAAHSHARGGYVVGDVSDGGGQAHREDEPARLTRARTTRPKRDSRYARATR